MRKLRRSRLAKFTAGMLIFILAVSIVGNIVGAVFLLEENLFYANRTQLQQKVYSYIYNFTASDLMSYLNIMENAYCNNDNYKNYHQSEIDLYESKYSPENSNIQFYISDENGNLLLSNNSKQNSEHFSFSSVYSTDINYYEWYKMGNSDSAEFVTGYKASTEDTTSFEGMTEIQDNSELQNTVTKENETQNSDITPDETDKYNVNRSTVSNSNTDNVIDITYYYSGEINNNILEHCKEKARFLSYDVTSLTFYQDEYTDADGVLAEKYSYTDDSRPERTVSCSLLSGNKSANIIYRYNGTLSFSEFTNRLSYSTLILQNSAEDNISLEYKQKARLQLKVNVEVPYYCSVGDIYKAAQTLVNVAIVYRDNIIPITVLDFILFLVSFIFIFYSAGYIPKNEKPVARALHAIPFDLYLLLSLSAAVGCYALTDIVGDELFAIAGFIGLVFIAISIIYTIPVRVRTHTFRTNNLIYKICKAIKNAAAITNEATGSRLAIVLTLLIFFSITGCEILLFVISDCFEAAVIVLFARLIEIPFIILILVALTALHNGAKAISKGDISYRIKNSLLVGPLKKHAAYLNSINDAVNNAVDERLRSESLKTELITNVSHDLKTPLTSIVNYVDLLKKEQVDNPKAIEYIEVIDRQSQRLKKLTIDIVEASKAATGNIDIHYEDTALNVILLQTNGEYIERLEEHNLTLIQDIPENDIVISADGRLLWRVIDNLMNNICKYSMPGTRVYLSLYEENGTAKISFKNISKNKLNIEPSDLTERFVRGDTSRNTEGSGLGLSIAKSLTENMGGKLFIFIDGDLFKVTLSFPIKIS